MYCVTSNGLPGTKIWRCFLASKSVGQIPFIRNAAEKIRNNLYLFLPLFKCLTSSRLYEPAAVWRVMSSSDRDKATLKCEHSKLKLYEQVRTWLVISTISSGVPCFEEISSPWLTAMLSKRSWSLGVSEDTNSNQTSEGGWKLWFYIPWWH